jgi:hypothetical protein
VEVGYTLDDGTVVHFEIDPNTGFGPAGTPRGTEQVSGRIRDAIGPLVAGAKIVLDKAREAGPAEVEVTFGIKVTGTMNWLVARAASEASFQVALTWKHED